MKPSLLLIGGLLVLQTSLALADEQTRRVQEELRRRHLYFGDVNGTKSAEVSLAIKSYQKRKGFPITGTTDGETLQSLGITTRSVTAQQPALPNEPVLRSDPAVRNEKVRQAAMTEVVDEEEPPEIVGEEPPPDVQEEARRLISNYLKDGETNDLQLEMRYYADSVDYFDEGQVDVPYLQRDISAYYKRWPERQYTLLDQPSIASTSPDGLITVKFRIGFICKRGKKKAQGETLNTFVLKPEDPGFKIVSMREQRVTR